MKFLEELSMNAFPSLQTVLYDGWVLRFADGYTNRPNSVNPIYSSNEDIEIKIEKCEKIYRSKNQRPVYKITPFVQPGDLDKLLELRGYKKIHPTLVQTLQLKELPEPSINSLQIFTDLDEKWLDIKNSDKKSRATYEKIQNNIIPFKFYVLLLIDGEAAACGMSVLENGYAGLFDIFVVEKYRNNGYGKQLLLNILKIAKGYGVNKAYLQVMKDNMPAVKLYKGLGFKEVYEYWYRVPEEQS